MTNISFEEIKRRLETTYHETKEKLKNYVNQEKFENDEFQGKYDVEIFFKIFENFRDSSQEEIENLIEENIRLRNELKSSYSIVNILIEKTDDIIQLTEENKELKRIQTDQSIIFKDFLETKSQIHSQKTDHLFENLNRIRDIVFDAHSKLKIKTSHIYKLKTNQSEANMTESIIKKKAFIYKKSFFDLIPKWMPEDVINKCMNLNCEKKFGLCRWKHNCRVCGGIFCSSCTNNFDSFLPFYVEDVRICVFCFQQKKYKQPNFEINFNSQNYLRNSSKKLSQKNSANA